ncbi:MAG: hypothetical protein OEX19_15820, partial [Gammaproteobacteria bacterium]|nr:hypothetical protein [Gammaproteobacteria bacterium]
GNLGFAIPVATTGSDRNVLISLTTMNNVQGIGIPGSAKDNFLSNITTVNNSSSGIRFFGELNSTNTIQNVAAVNNSIGLDVNGRNDGTLSYFLFNNVVSADNDFGILIGAAPTNTFHGWLKVGSLTSNCEFPVENVNGGLFPDCSPRGDSTFVLRNNVTSTGSFIAKVTVDDTQNQSDINGLISYDLITDWLSFENRFRGWGLNNSPFPSANHQGQCLSGNNCRIWDWSAATGDFGDPFNSGTPVLLGVNDVPTGDDWLVHTWKVPGGEPDCNAIAGAVWDSVTCTTTFLKNAVERIGDFIGNENGFCESDETCYYTPNIGAYQGHNTYEPADKFVDGIITGVSLKRSSVNGR